MTDAEKIEAFDLIALAMTNQWASGDWTWFNGNPAGGPKRATREEAVADLIDYSRREASHLERRGKAFARMAQE